MEARRTGPTIRQRELRRKLQDLRADAGRTALDVAKALGPGWSASRLVRMEKTSTRPKPEAVVQLLDEYRITDRAERSRILNLVAEARERGWWDDYQNIIRDRAAIYVGLENDASGLRTYESQLVPSLLQTPEYARAALERRLPWPDAGTLDRQVELRMRRQQVLTGPHPLTMWAIIDEAALNRMVGGPQIMRDQLAHLVEMSRRSHVHIQVLPFGAGAHAGASTFIVLDFEDSVEPEVVYLESVGASTFVEDAEQVELFRVAFESLLDDAWSVIETREVLEKLLPKLG